MPQNEPTASNGNGNSWLMQLLKTLFWFWMIRNIVSAVKFFSASQNLENGNVPQELRLSNLWENVQNVQLVVYFSDNRYFQADQSIEIYKSEFKLRQLETQFKDFNFTLKKGNSNSSLFVHAFLLNGDDQIYTFKEITSFHKVLKNSKKNLLDDDKSLESSEIQSHWWPNITITLVDYFGILGQKLPPNVVKEIKSNGNGYYPIFFINDFWMLKDQLIPLNDTVEKVPVYLEVTSIPFWKFQLYKQFEESFRVQKEVMGMPSKDMDELKRLFLETNPVLLVITFLVSILHSIFDFLAFKNDVEFWKSKSNLEGLSFRTIVLNILFQGIVFLYLLDNDTSWVILISSGTGLLIEMWKVNKAVKIKKSDKWPFIVFEGRLKPSKLTKKTQKYDELAFGYLSYVLFPCLIGYTIYSLIYEEHKGWYSFVISTLVGFVYAFGFISMTPQLFINYKLKSVAHMPWKTFMYKALNTFIDDLFAFVVTMPMMHRLACLRDDVVFLVYLYQKWIYPEDKRRRNEFGQVGEADKESDEEDESDHQDSETRETRDDKLLKDGKDALEEDAQEVRDKNDRKNHKNKNLKQRKTNKSL